jgi:hypothetical protein
MQPINIGAKIYDLCHLNIIRRKSTAELRQSKKEVPVEVHFSCHCWSRKPLENEPIPPTHLILDGSKVAPRNRIFCESRYELSLELPKLIDDMLQTNRRVYYTHRDNIVRIDWVAPIVAGPAPEQYYLFMKMEKKTPEGQAKHVKIFVESAYPDSVMYENPSYGKPVSFSKLLGDCWELRYPQ